MTFALLYHLLEICSLLWLKLVHLKHGRVYWCFGSALALIKDKLLEGQDYMGKAMFCRCLDGHIFLTILKG